MFYGEKLRGLRALCANSRTELAESLAVEEILLKQVENNRMTPDFMLLQKLQKHFAVRPSYFFREPYVAEVMDTSRISYREEMTSTRNYIENEKTFLNVFFTHLSRLEEIVFPTQDYIMGLAEEIEERYHLPALVDEEVRQIAKTVREEFQITTNQRLMYFLEVSGVYIVERNLNNRAHAYSACL